MMEVWGRVRGIGEQLEMGTGVSVREELGG